MSFLTDWFGNSNPYAGRGGTPTPPGVPGTPADSRGGTFPSGVPFTATTPADVPSIANGIPTYLNDPNAFNSAATPALNEGFTGALGSTSDIGNPSADLSGVTGSNLAATSVDPNSDFNFFGLNPVSPDTSTISEGLAAPASTDYGTFGLQPPSGLSTAADVVPPAGLAGTDTGSVPVGTPATGSTSAGDWIQGLLTDLNVFFQRFALIGLAMVLIAGAAWAMMHHAGVTQSSPGSAWRKLRAAA